MALAEPMVRHVVRRWASAHHDRDDLRQACRLRLLVRRSEFDPSVRDWSDWVFRICDQACRAIVRRESRREKICRRSSEVELSRVSGELFDGLDESPVLVSERNEFADRVRRRVQVLPPHVRRLLVRMFGLDGQAATETIAGTAASFGMPVQDCGAAIRRGMDALRASLVEGVDHADVA
ncbi:MAG: sigma-70 family RNA polymerase sigma factor [Planctomycetia bacterium]|nr:sigma-70 family RNA polymerase sigma factor [Planctomycetia bacterium]